MCKHSRNENAKKRDVYVCKRNKMNFLTFLANICATSKRLWVKSTCSYTKPKSPKAFIFSTKVHGIDLGLHYCFSHSKYSFCPDTFWTQLVWQYNFHINFSLTAAHSFYSFLFFPSLLKYSLLASTHLLNSSLPSFIFFSSPFFIPAIITITFFLLQLQRRLYPFRRLIIE